MARLRRVSPQMKGWTRRRTGKSFTYLDADGQRLPAEQVERIRSLAIPPAWRDVWICPYPNGHIQAVGIDAAGRKQYRYHQKWRERRDQIKFDRMLEFARALRLLDRGFFRIGGEEYAEENESYGLATMKKRHVTLEDGHAIRFDYPAKSGKRQVRSVVDPDVYRVVAALKRRRAGGQELLAYRADDAWFDVKSADINAYIKEATGGDFSAKDFRTWSGTVLAATGLAVSGGVATSPTARKRAVTRVI